MPRKTKVLEPLAVEKKQSFVEIEKPMVKRTLDDVWNHKYSKYKTSDAVAYKASLSKMNKADLQRECINHDLLPHDNRDIMGERLMKQFTIYQAGLKPVARFKNGTGSTNGRAQDILSRIAPRLA